MAHDPLEYLQSVWHRSTSYTYRMPFKIDASIANADERALRHIRDSVRKSGWHFT